MHEIQPRLEQYYQRELRRAGGRFNRIKDALSQTFHQRSLGELSSLKRSEIERFTKQHSFRFLGRYELIWWLHRASNGILGGPLENDPKVLRVMAVMRNTLIRLGRLPEGSYRL